MVFEYYVLLKKANIRINLISFSHNFDHQHVTVVTLVPRKQSEKPRFFHKNIGFVEKVFNTFDMYLLSGLSSLFSQNRWAVLKNCYFCCTFEKLTQNIPFTQLCPTIFEKMPDFQNDQRSRENRTNMDIILLFLAKQPDKHGITPLHITIPPLMIESGPVVIRFWALDTGCHLRVLRQ